MPELMYEERPPSPRLAPFVECYWTLHGSAPLEEQKPERVLPDGRIEIVLNIGDPVWQTLGGSTFRQHSTLLVGPTSRPVFIGPRGSVRMLGIRFRHGGAHAVLGVPAALLVDTIVPLGDVAHALPASLDEELAAAPGFEAQVRIVERYLIIRLRDRSGDDVASAAAVGIILATDGAVDVARVAAHAGVSSRQLGRRFYREVGIGPKLLARLTRFHALLRLVASDRPPTLAAAAARAGYVDQSHLARDFREFAAQPASEYLRERHALSEFFLGLEADGS